MDGNMPPPEHLLCTDDEQDPCPAVTVVVSAQQALQVLESTDAETFQLILSVRHCLAVSNIEMLP